MSEDLQTLAKIHNDPKMGKSFQLPRRKNSRGKGVPTLHVRTSSNLTASSGGDDDDLISVDSEMSLVYVPGMKMNDEETKDLLRQLTEKKKELNRCKADLRKVNAEMKSSQLSHDNQVRRLQTQIEKLEKAKDEALSIKNDVAKQMKNIASLRSAGTLQLEKNNADANAGTDEKAVAKIRKDLIRLQKELDSEK
ncbi:hypothetical protein RFI_21495, partial [Reticulomyxa filosa]